MQILPTGDEGTQVQAARYVNSHVVCICSGADFGRQRIDF